MCPLSGSDPGLQNGRGTSVGPGTGFYLTATLTISMLFSQIPVPIKTYTLQAEPPMPPLDSQLIIWL